MNRKVWVISERDWHQAGRKPDRQAKRQKAAVGNAGKKRKSPALALSLSLFLWGSGHVYAGRYKTGLLLIIAMILALGSLAGMILPAGLNFDRQSVFAVPLFLALLCISFYAAVDAYFQAADKRSVPFSGIENEYCSMLASLVLPGWGQFLNGQAGKGLFYGIAGVLGYIGLLILSVAWRLWNLPTLEANMARIELPLLAVLLAAPLLLLIWTVSVHDAYWACKYPRLKKPVRERARFVLERIRRRGIVKGLFRELRGIVLLTLLLSSVLFAAWVALPGADYAAMAKKLGNEMHARGMNTIPGLLDGLFKGL